MKPDESAPWRKLLKSETLERWSDDISIVDRQSLSSGPRPASAVVVSDKVAPSELVRFCHESKAHQLVQVSHPKFDASVCFAGMLLCDPEKFLGNPVDAFFSTRGSQGTEPVQSRVVPFQRTSEKTKVIGEIRTFLASLNRTATVQAPALMVIDELFTNAMFNSPVDGNGQRRFASLPRSSQVEFEPGKTGNLGVASDGQALLVYAEDPYGTLKADEILSRIDSVYQRNGGGPMSLQAMTSGIGCYMIFETGNSFIVAVQPGVKTIVASLFLLGLGAKVLAAVPKNLHVHAP